MTQFASDAFAAGSTVALESYSASWAKFGSDGSLSVSSTYGRVFYSTVAGTRYEYNATPSSADYSVSVDVYVASTLANSCAGPIARAVAASGNAYLVRTIQGTGYQMFKCVGGSYTQLGSNSSKTFTAGSTYNVRLECIGTAINAYFEGSSSAGISATDSAISAAGKPGIYKYEAGSGTETTGHHVDNFSADESSGAVLVTSSAAGRLRARGTDVVAPIKASAEAGRLRARGATSTQPISVVAATGRLRARGSDVVTSIRPAASAGRLRARGGCTATQVSAGIIVTSAAGRLRARGGCTATSIRTAAAVGLLRDRGATTATSIRTGLATGRVKARGANNAAPIVAGTVVTSAAGRLRARGSSSSATTRIVGEVGRLRLRGVVTVATIRPAGVGGRLRVRGYAAAGPYVPPTLPIEVPETTRTLNAEEGRLGSSPVASDPRRLGAATTRKAPPRLG